MCLNFCSLFHHKLFKNMLCKFHFPFPAGEDHSVEKSPFSRQSREWGIFQAVVFLEEEERKYISLPYLRQNQGEPHEEREEEGPGMQVSLPQNTLVNSAHVTPPANGAQVEVIKMLLIYGKFMATLLGISQELLL